MYLAELSIWNESVVDTFDVATMALNAFPAGARARLALIGPPGCFTESKLREKLQAKYDEASRLVSECEALQRGEGK